MLGFVQQWKGSLDKKGYAGAVIMDLSKTFDTINYELFLAKLNACGFDKRSLEIMRNYLSNHWQRTNINIIMSSWSALLNVVPPESVLEPNLFNILRFKRYRYW